MESSGMNQQRFEGGGEIGEVDNDLTLPDNPDDLTIEPDNPDDLPIEPDPGVKNEVPNPDDLILPEEVEETKPLNPVDDILGK